MKTLKFCLYLLMLAALLFGQVGAVQAAPPRESETPQTPGPGAAQPAPEAEVVQAPYAPEITGPMLSIPLQIPAQPNNTVVVPIQFAANGFAISSMVFSVFYDPAWLTFDSHVPFSITLSLPAGFSGGCNYDLADTDGQIDCYILDAIAPLSALPSGTLASIILRTGNPPTTIEAPVGFSVNSPPTSFGNTAGQSVPGTTQDGSVLIGLGPVLYNLDPNTATAGSPGFTMTVNGANFINGAVVWWSATSLTTTFVNSGQLTALVPAGLIASPATIPVTVVNPGAITSNALNFSVTSAPAAPVLDSISPDSRLEDSTGFTLTGNGSNFTPSTVLRWNGIDLPTTFVSSTRLDATVDASRITNPGNIPICAYTPPPGGGQSSNCPPFQILSAPKKIFLPLIVRVPPATNLISGRVTYSNDNPVEGVSICDQNGRCTVTDTAGYYTLSGLPSGSHTLTPWKSGLTFSPGNRTVTLPPDATNQNFTAYTACPDIITNGSFETTGGWEFPATEYTARRSTILSHSGIWSAQTGIIDPYLNRFSYSSTRQLVYVPSDASSATLHFWIFPISYDLLNALPPPEPKLNEPFGTEVLSGGDVQYVLVLDAWGNTLRTLIWRLSDAEKWQYREYSLLEFAGQLIYLHFGTYNDGWGSVSSQFVDDVSMEVCR